MKSSPDDGPGPPRPPATFGAAFAQALYRRDESLEGLRRKLRARGHTVSLATLSYWRSGQRRPEHAASLEAVAEIELLLGLWSGELRSRLGPSSRRTPDDVASSVADAASDRGDAAQQVLDLLRRDQTAELAEQSVQARVEVAADGTVTGLDVRTVWRALGDGAQHAPIVWFADDALTALPVLTATGGGELDVDHSRPDLGVLARSLRLERPLAVREEAVTEYHLDLPATPDTYFEYVLIRRVQEILLWVRFTDPSPSGATRYWGAEGDEGSEEVDLTGRTSVHHRRRRFGPGHVGVRWS